MARRVFLLIGTPGAASAHLRRRLWANTSALGAAGLLVPGHERRHLSAARELVRRRPDDPTADGTAWAKLAAETAAWDGDAVIGYETMAAALVDRSTPIVEMFAPAEVHVVLAAVPLARSLVESWQYQLVAADAAPFEVYSARVRDHERRGIGFWRVQDLAGVARRWSPRVRPQRIHLLPATCDRAADDDLWQRLLSILVDDSGQLDDVAAPAPVDARLGAVESELLFRIHGVRDPRFTDRERHPWTQTVLVDEILRSRQGAAPLAPPSGSQEWLAEETALMVRQVTAGGYDVVGDLGDLAWTPPEPGARTLDGVTIKEVNAAARWTIARLQEIWVEQMPRSFPPEVGPEDGIPGILQLLEHLRALDTGSDPRPAPSQRTFTTDRLRRGISARRAT